MGVLERFSMQGKKVVVTGGAQGIGRAGAEAMAEAGAEVGIFDLNLEIAEKTAKEIEEAYGHKAKAYRCDVTDEDAVIATFAAFVADFGTLDGVFNNAGICIHKNAEEVSKAEWCKVLDVNLNGIFVVARGGTFVPEGRKKGVHREHGFYVRHDRQCSAASGILQCFKGCRCAPDKEPCSRVGRKGHSRQLHQSRIYLYGACGKAGSGSAENLARYDSGTPYGYAG